ncbi:MAG: guanine deaminase [Proteobacteria bacterium]|nr:guanine deaminase [Pseudomonadota bacterium]
MEDAALLVDEFGLIRAKGSFLDILKRAPAAVIHDFRGKLLIPGFLDTHVHFPQLNMIGQMAPSLLPWLEQYTFPTEKAFQGRTAFVTEAAHQFVDELQANGTSLACVYSSSDYEATDLLFEVFAQRGMRGIIGKTSMDRHAPAELLIKAEIDLADQERLIQRWQGYEERLAVALTPRFAPACTPELMQGLGQLHRKYPSTYVQTHYAENLGELEWVKKLFPKAQDYLDVYESFGLIGPRTILAHGIHVEASARERLANKKAILSHCPSSNLFLGSGLFDWQAMKSQEVSIAIGTDVGAGTSFSMWQTLNEAHKVGALAGHAMSGHELFAAATLGAGQSLGFEDLGSLDEGYQADFQVIDARARALLDRRIKACKNLEEMLSALIHLCDDRCLESLWIRGKKVRSKF